MAHADTSRAIRTGPSGIEGLGVFAVERFSPGAIVLTIDDSYVVDETHPAPVGEEIHCDYLQGGRAVWMQVPERHINHSCQPNVFLRTVDGARQLIALRAIAAGDEIVYDYCINGYGDTVWQCSCGAARCRQIIHSDFFHLPVAKQLEYLPLLDGWFRHERAVEIEELLAKPQRWRVPPRSWD